MKNLWACERFRRCEGPGSTKTCRRCFSSCCPFLVLSWLSWGCRCYSLFLVLVIVLLLAFSVVSHVPVVVKMSLVSFFLVLFIVSLLGILVVSPRCRSCRRVVVVVILFVWFLTLLSFRQVDLALDVEKALPRKLRKKLMSTNEIIRPNQMSGFAAYFNRAAISPKQLRAALNPERVRTTQLWDGAGSSRQL